MKSVAISALLLGLGLIVASDLRAENRSSEVGSAVLYLAEYESFRDVPPIFQSAIELGNSAENKKRDTLGRTKISLTLLNDYVGIGIGAIASLSGKKINGNDTGLTHGTRIDVDHALPSGFTHHLTLGTELYTRDVVDPVNADHIHFTEENFLKYIVDTRQKKIPFFYEIGAGLVLDSREKNSHGARQQQEWFHSTFNSDNNAQYEYDAGESELGAFVHAALGIQKQWILNPFLKASVSDKVVVVPHTIKNGSRVMDELEMSLTLMIKQHLLELAAKGSVSLHGEGVELIPAITLRYEGRHWGVVSSVAFPQGDLYNPMHYNDDRDPVATLTFYFILDPKKDPKSAFRYGTP